MQKPLWLKGNKVLSFTQEPSFYAKAGRRYAERGALAPAYQNYRKAIDRDPDNVEYKLALAGVLSDMERYEEANQWLLRLTKEINPVPAECEFGIGYNYLCMQEYELAASALETFLQHYDVGELAEQAEDMLAFIAEELQSMAEEEGISQETAQMAEMGKQLLDRGQGQQAAAVLERVLKRAPGLSYAKNNLALAYYLNGETEKACDLVRQMVKTEPENVHAICNLLIFAGKKYPERETQALLDKLDSMQPEGLDEIYKAAMTMAQAGREQSALKFFSLAVEQRPYDPKTLFCAGVAAYNCKEYAKSVRWFDTMAQVDDFFAVAPFYRSMAKKAEQGDAPYEKLDYYPQLPPAKVIQQMTEISRWSKQSKEQIRQLWNTDATFRDTVRWGLHMLDPHMTQAMAEILGIIGTPDAEEWLRETLMVPEMDLEQKQYIFGVLKRMEAKEPYVALTMEGLMEVHVSSVPKLPEDLPENYQTVMALLKQRGEEETNKGAGLLAQSVWAAYVNTLKGSYPDMEANAMAQAVWALALKRTDTLETELSKRYYAEVLKALEEQNDEN